MTWSGGGSLPGGRNRENKGERYGYDDAGQLASVIYNANNVTTATPSGQDRSVSYANTPLNRVRRDGQRGADDQLHPQRQ